MRRVRYSVAMTLDGYVAGPKVESDWIVMDPEIDFAALASSFDTMLLGRKTYEAARQQGGGPAMPGMHTVAARPRGAGEVEAHQTQGVYQDGHSGSRVRRGVRRCPTTRSPC